MDPIISVVIPVYEEEGLIYRSIREIHKVFENNRISHEFVIVDDGSKDNTLHELIRLLDEIPNLKAYRLIRNFGKESALCAGLEMARGNAYIVMDADLQHPPGIIPEMIRLWHDEGYQVVEGVKISRGNESFFSRLSAGTFYKLLKKLSGFNLENASDFKLLDAKVVNAWRQMPERDTFFRAMSAWVGFKRTSITFSVSDRINGVTKWSVFELFRLALTAITAFSAVPLQIITLLGFIFLAGSLILGIQTLYTKFSGLAVSGFTTVILLLLIMGSALMISLGIIGIYVARIYDEVKARPRYIISENIENKKNI